MGLVAMVLLFYLYSQQMLDIGLILLAARELLHGNQVINRGNMDGDAGDDARLRPFKRLVEGKRRLYKQVDRRVTMPWRP